MRVVILHCHYERGGVTQVVENHVRALRSAGVGDVVLVSGPRQSGLSEATCEFVKRWVVEDFDYDRDTAETDTIESRAEKISDDLTEKLGRAGATPGDTVLHWHNHGLGKNTAAPAVIRGLAEAGWKLLLQVHDFAEDNRPENLRRLIRATGASDKRQLGSYLYPVANQIHYANLTIADADVLKRIGIPESQTHVIPNSVVLAGVDDRPNQEEALGRVREAMELPADARWCLYPVRGIRRKNVGEFVLLCRWMGESRYGGLTLCPDTPVEKRSYLRWKELAARLAPRAVFDAAHHPGVSFADNLAASDFVISTSVAEGFGMAYLEPWLAGRRVVARRLPTVMDDFVASGIRLPDLYDGVPIPGDRTWLTRCREESSRAETESWTTVAEAFRPSLSRPSDSHDSIDFARLTPARQVEVLRRMDADEGFESDVQQRSEQLIKSLHCPSDPSLVSHNAEVIRSVYSPLQQAEQLTSIYGSLVRSDSDATVAAAENADAAIDLVTAMRPFCPCRTEILDSEMETLR